MKYFPASVIAVAVWCSAQPGPLGAAAPLGGVPPLLCASAKGYCASDGASHPANFSLISVTDDGEVDEKACDAFSAFPSRGRTPPILVKNPFLQTEP